MRNSKLNNYEVIYFQTPDQGNFVYTIGFCKLNSLSKKRLKTIKRSYYGKEVGVIGTMSACRFFDTVTEMKDKLPEF